MRSLGSSVRRGRGLVPAIVATMLLVAALGALLLYLEGGFVPDDAESEWLDSMGTANGFRAPGDDGSFTVDDG